MPFDRQGCTNGSWRCLVEQVVARANMQQEDWGIREVSDIDVASVKGKTHLDHPNAKHSTIVGEVNRRLAAEVTNEAKRGNFVLTLGGDHSVVRLSVSVATCV